MMLPAGSRVVKASANGCSAPRARRLGGGFVLRLLRVDIHPSALKHGVAVEDIEHAVRNAMVIDELEDDLRLYLGPTRDGALLEVITIPREGDREELAIHAMAMRAKYRRLLPGV